MLLQSFTKGCESLSPFSMPSSMREAISSRCSLGPFPCVIPCVQVGWNQDYVFSKKNLQLALSYLLNYVMESEDISIKAITYLVSDCIYGSGMDDPLDLSTLQTVLSKFCCQEVVANTEHAMDPEGVYTVKSHESLEAMQTWVSELPRGTGRHLLGVREPVARQRDREAAHSLLHRLALTQGLTRASTALSGTQAVLARVDSILGCLPQPFDLAVIQENFGDEKLQSLNIVLLQVSPPAPALPPCSRSSTPATC